MTRRLYAGLLCVSLLYASAALAQERRGVVPPARPDLGGGRARADRGGPAADGGVSPAEIQRLFDAYVVMQAQEALQLDDAQFSRFLPQMRALQDARRRRIAERARRLDDLRQQSDAGRVDDAQARAALRALEDWMARSEADVRRATAAVDAVLDPRQQLRFRVFEEMMDRRKLDLVARARQARRAPRP